MRFETSPPQHHIADSNVALVTVEVFNTSYLGNAHIDVYSDRDIPCHTNISLFPRGPCCSSPSGLACSLPVCRGKGPAQWQYETFNRDQFLPNQCKMWPVIVFRAFSEFVIRGIDTLSTWFWTRLKDHDSEGVHESSMRFLFFG